MWTADRQENGAERGAFQKESAQSKRLFAQDE